MEKTRVYRWKWYTILLNFASLLYLVPLLIVTPFIVAFLVFVATLSYPGKEIKPLVLTIFCVGPFVLFLLLYIAVLVGRFLLSHLKVSSDGLEYRYWPTYAIRASWEDVEYLGKYNSLGIIPYDALYLKTASPFGWQIMMAFRRAVGLSTQYLVPLTGFHGWPKGQLADDLREYVPHVFNAEEIEQDQH